MKKMKKKPEIILKEVRDKLKHVDLSFISSGRNERFTRLVNLITELRNITGVRNEP